MPISKLNKLINRVKKRKEEKWRELNNKWFKREKEFNKGRNQEHPNLEMSQGPKEDHKKV